MADKTGGFDLVNVVGDRVDASSNWTLSKVLVLLLTLTFLGLFFDLRYEHVDKLHRHWTAWIPIYYSGIMFIAGLMALNFWSRGGRQALFYSFAIGIVVGILGFYFHNQHHIVQDVLITLEAWIKNERHADAPPTLAPLAFCGLGVIGMIACSFRDSRS